MFQFPSLAYAPYVFRYASPRITTGGFPHSEIPGSVIGQHLPRAYRSRPRPSSALGAKASTVCSYSLDRKEHVLMSLWSFQGARERVGPPNRDNRPGSPRSGIGTVSQNSTAWIRRVRHCSRRTDCTGRASSSTGPAPTGVRAPVSLERR